MWHALCHQAPNFICFNEIIKENDFDTQFSKLHRRHLKTCQTSTLNLRRLHLSIKLIRNMNRSDVFPTNFLVFRINILSFYENSESN